MDIHREVDHILANTSQPSLLCFEFHSEGCTVTLSNATGEHKHELTAYELLGFSYDSDDLFRRMQAGTIVSFRQEQQL